MRANQLEWDACRQLGMRVVHMPMDSGAAPTREFLLQLDEVFGRLERPLLLHCKSGADRASFVSAFYLLSRTDTPVEVALRHLRLWPYGHFRYAGTGVLDHFFDSYRRQHARDGITFRDWIRHGYDQQAVQASFNANRWAELLVRRVLRRE